MWILLVLLAITMIGIVILNYAPGRLEFSDGYELFGVGFTVVGGIFLIIFLMLLPLNRYLTNVEISGFKSVEQTIQDARMNGDNIENTAFLIKIAEKNEWLAKIQHRNNTVLRLWYPNEVDKLEPLR